MHGRKFIKYVKEESIKIGSRPIEAYTRAKICGSAIESWSATNSKVKQLLRYRVEKALCDIADQNNIKRKMNEAVYKS